MSSLLRSSVCRHNVILVSLLPGYVGAATVGAAAWWFTVCEDGPQLTLYQLVSVFCLKLLSHNHCKSELISTLPAGAVCENLRVIFLRTYGKGVGMLMKIESFDWPETEGILTSMCVEERVIYTNNSYRIPEGRFGTSCQRETGILDIVRRIMSRRSSENVAWETILQLSPLHPHPTASLPL